MVIQAYPLARLSAAFGEQTTMNFRFYLEPQSSCNTNPLCYSLVLKINEKFKGALPAC